MKTFLPNAADKKMPQFPPQSVVGVYSHPGAGLREAPLDEDLLADVPQRVGDRSGGDITPKMYISEIMTMS